MLIAFWKNLIGWLPVWIRSYQMQQCNIFLELLLFSFQQVVHYTLLSYYFQNCILTPTKSPSLASLSPTLLIFDPSFLFVHVISSFVVSFHNLCLVYVVLCLYMLSLFCVVPLWRRFLQCLLMNILFWRLMNGVPLLLQKFRNRRLFLQLHD